MTYATRNDLELLGGPDEVAQRESALPAGAVDDILAKADALIDGYLVGRYTLPLTVIPENLPQTAAAIARYNLLGESATDRSRKDFEDAISLLKDIQSGRVLLGAAAPLPGNDPATVVMAESSPAVFKRGIRP